jgi:uncharacterized protein (TIGR00251 family)
MDSMPFLTSQGDGCPHLTIHVQPRASRTGFCGIYGDSLKMAVTAPPLDGKANKEVIAFLAAVLKIPKKDITIVSGMQSRTKRCRIGSLNEDEVRERVASKIHGSTGGGG